MKLLREIIRSFWASFWKVGLRKIPVPGELWILYSQRNNPFTTTENAVYVDRVYRGWVSYKFSPNGEPGLVFYAPITEFMTLYCLPK